MRFLPSNRSVNQLYYGETVAQFFHVVLQRQQGSAKFRLGENLQLSLRIVVKIEANAAHWLQIADLDRLACDLGVQFAGGLET